MYKRQISGTNVTYKIRFCQPFPMGGVGSEARMINTITDTLWANITYVPGVNNIASTLLIPIINVLAVAAALAGLMVLLPFDNDAHTLHQLLHYYEI